MKYVRELVMFDAIKLLFTQIYKNKDTVTCFVHP